MKLAIYLASAAFLTASQSALATTTTYDGDLAGFTFSWGQAVATFSPQISCADGEDVCFVGENPATPPPGAFTLTTDPGSNINFTTYNYYAPTLYDHNFITQSYEPNRPNYVNITFNLAGVRAFGLDIGTYQGMTVQFDLSDGTSFTDHGSANFGETKFIGFISDDADLTSLTITTPDLGEDYVITQLHTGQVAPVPEAAEWAMLMAGLGVAGAMAKRRRVSDGH